LLFFFQILDIIKDIIQEKASIINIKITKLDIFEISNGLINFSIQYLIISSHATAVIIATKKAASG